MIPGNYTTKQYDESLTNYLPAARLNGPKVLGGLPPELKVSADKAECVLFDCVYFHS